MHGRVARLTMVRRLLVLVTAFLIGAQIVRNAAVHAWSERSPYAAARWWSGHPAAEVAKGMTEIGKAARDRKPVPDAVFAEIDAAAVKAPLAPEPFLVRGVQSELAGKMELATEAFAAAELRDARSLPAHYFLADAFYRQGDTKRALDEIGMLVRFAPHGVETLAPYMTTIAKDQRIWPQLRRLFRDNTGLEDASLSAMSADPANADTILALATPGRPGTNWPVSLVNSLVGAGQYARAREIWSVLHHVRLAPGSILYDSGFTDAEAPAPFNWTLNSSAVGLAEREKGGHLHVIFYGREEGVLAAQLILLPPGTYQLTSPFSGEAARAAALSWSVRCGAAGKPYATTGLDKAGQGWTFDVPPDCPAQWLELAGTSGEVAQQVDLTIDYVRLVPERAHG